MTLTLDFQGQTLKMLYLRNGRAIWHGTKGMWVDRMFMMLDSHCDLEFRPQPWPWPWIFRVNFYASAFRRRRHYVFGLSVRPSVRLSVRPSIRPKPEIASFDLYMCPLVHPTNRNRFTACPSVRLSVRPSVRPSVRRGFRAFAGERMEGMAWNFTCWCILTVFRTD